MEKKQIHLKVITPEKTAYEDTVDLVVVPTQLGEITILPDHIPYITTLSPGILETKKDGEIHAMAVTGGFLEFHKNELTLMADTAERAEEIDLEEAEAARKRAEQMKLEKSKMMDESQYAAVASMVEKQLARIKLAKRFHTTRRMHLGNGNGNGK